MQTRLSPALLALLSLFAVPASRAAIVYMDDPFTDGDKTNGLDPNDTTWFLNNTTSSSLSVASDPVINSGNALRLNATASFRKFFGSFGAVTLAQGETLQLSFDYRFHEAASGAGLFRFGLYNNGGSAPNADGSPADNDDFGYAAITNPGADVSNGTSVNSEIAGDAALGGSAPSGLIVFGTTGASVNVGTTLPGNAVFSITRNFDDSLTVSSSINGQSAASGTITTSPITYTFHHAVIGLGSSASDFSVDNVNVSVIPEPSCLLLSALGLAAAASRRRRN